MDTFQNMQSAHILEDKDSDNDPKPSDTKFKVEKTSEGPDACPLMAEEEHGSQSKSVDALAKSLAAMSNSLENKPDKQKSETNKKKEELGKDILDSLAESKLKMLTFKVSAFH